VKDIPGHAAGWRLYQDQSTKLSSKLLDDAGTTRLPSWGGVAYVVVPKNGWLNVRCQKTDTTHGSGDGDMNKGDWNSILSLAAGGGKVTVKFACWDQYEYPTFYAGWV